MADPEGDGVSLEESRVERERLYQKISTVQLPSKKPDNDPFRPVARVFLVIALIFGWLNAAVIIPLLLLGTMFCDSCGPWIRSANDYAEKFDAPMLKLFIPMGFLFLKLGVPFLFSGFGIYLLVKFFYNRRAYIPAIAVGALRPALFVIGAFTHIAFGHGLAHFATSETARDIIMLLML